MAVSPADPTLPHEPVLATRPTCRRGRPGRMLVQLSPPGLSGPMLTPDESAGGPPLADRTDRSLLLRLRRGEDDAATALYVRYARRLLALTRSKTSSDLDRQVEAEDIVQSVFLSFFRKASD